MKKFYLAVLSNKYMEMEDGTKKRYIKRITEVDTFKAYDQMKKIPGGIFLTLPVALNGHWHVSEEMKKKIEEKLKEQKNNASEIEKKKSDGNKNKNSLDRLETS